ncbi:MAG: DUF255 domain-containing protein [Pseudomonadota bacterium]
MLRTVAIVLFFCFGSTNAIAQSAPEAEPPQIEWLEWNDELFERAAATGRHIVLDLNASWCHWCHFMEERTYAHPAVRDVIDRAYFAVKVDQDANPDLAVRYGDWGWPATIIFSPDGEEVAKLQGFQRPSLMTQILYTVVAAPDEVPELLNAPKVSPVIDGGLSDEARQRIVGLLDETYDKEFGGWGQRLKFLQPHIIEYALQQARAGDVQFRERLIESLDAAMVLNDPVWGGMYQYSHERDWSAPHYEKIMAFQANGMSIYADAYREFGAQAYLETANSIADYLLTYMQDESGAFYTSQNADVDSEVLGADFYALDHEGRIAFGRAPSIDTNLYVRENGWIASGLLDLYAVTGNTKHLKAAKAALTWIVENRGLQGGGFAHGANDAGGPYLAANIAMGPAMLKLYMATGDTVWLKRAGDLAIFLDNNFRHRQAGYISTKKPLVEAAAFKDPHLSVEENIEVARFGNLLAHTYGDVRFRDMAVHAMRFLVSDSVTSRRRFMLGTVLSADELKVEPAHVTVVGSKSDTAVQDLHRAALKLSIDYLRVDLWDPSDGPMFNPDIEYPQMDQAAAFACANGICSLPIFTEAELLDTVEGLLD